MNLFILFVIALFIGVALAVTLIPHLHLENKRRKQSFLDMTVSDFMSGKWGEDD